MLDTEISEFLRQSDSFYPDDPISLSIGEQRERYIALCRAFQYDYPEGLIASDAAIEVNGGTVALRHYSPAACRVSNTAILYFHGGSFMLGSLESHDSICADLSEAAALPLIAVDYRLAPEHRHPTQLHDAEAAFRYALSFFDRIIVTGDSAGGNLAASLSVTCRNNERKPIGQVLIYPSLGGELMDAESYVTHASAPALTTDHIHYYQRVRVDGDLPKSDPTFFPLVLDDFAAMPPCVGFSADIDPLRDDVVLYVDRLQTAGVYARAVNLSGLIHGFLRARRVSAKAAAGFSQIADAICELAESC
ncbi:MAG: alpha/beta hydrolase [Pseudomonadota bacterium]